MNKALKTLLITALVMSATHVEAYTNKTFLLPRSQGVNLPLENTTFSELVGRKKAGKFGGNVQVSVFGQGSTNRREQAKYFLFKDKRSVMLKNSDFAAAKANVDDLDLGYLVHNNLETTAAGVNHQEAILSFDPEQIVYGVRFDYHQNLDKVLKGLYLKIDLPAVCVENDVRIKISATGNFPQYIGSADAAGAPVKETLEKLFRGEFEIQSTGDNANRNNQARLINAKIAGKLSKTSVADIDVALGYKFLKKENYGAVVAVAITIPTGNEAEGVYLFEPMVGNGKHFGVGGDLCVHGRLWGNVDRNIKLHLKMKYRYLFESDEKRTLGIKGYNFGQYHLLHELVGGQTVARKQLIHAANVTTLDVNIFPGNQFDGILGLAYNSGGFNLDLGYNMYFREGESTKLKGTIAASTYAVAARSISISENDFSGALEPANDIDGGSATAVYVDNTTVDVGAAATPSQFTNSLYGGVGYVFKQWDDPLMLGAGFKYEWASKNSALDQWSVDGKIGIGF